MPIFCFQDFGDFGEAFICLPTRRLGKDDRVLVHDERAFVIKAVIVEIPRKCKAIVVDFRQLLWLSQLFPRELVQASVDPLNIFSDAGPILIRTKLLKGWIANEGEYRPYKPGQFGQLESINSS